MKNFRRIAELRSAHLPPSKPTGSPILDAAMRAIEEAGIAASANFLRRADAHRREIVKRCEETPRLVFALPFFRLSGPTPLSLDDAVGIATSAYRRERERGRQRHWSFDPNQLDAAWEAAVVARLFRRRGRNAWKKEAA